MSVIVVIAQGLAVWVVTDFLSGVFHWMEDAYGKPSWPVVGRHVTKPNILHHYVPRAFVTNSWFVTSRSLLALCTVIVAITVALGVFRSQTPQGAPDWTGLMAGTTIAIIPTFIIFMLLGRKILDSIQFTGFK